MKNPLRRAGREKAGIEGSAEILDFPRSFINWLAHGQLFRLIAITHTVCTTCWRRSDEALADFNVGHSQ